MITRVLISKVVFYIRGRRNRIFHIIFFFLFIGLGPGGIILIHTAVVVAHKCIPGASHGGEGGRQYDSHFFFEVPKPYDKSNTASLLGGSGGKVRLLLFKRH